MSKKIISAVQDMDDTVYDSAEELLTSYGKDFGEKNNKKFRKYLEKIGWKSLSKLLTPNHDTEK